MKRRNFLKNIAALSAGSTVMLNGIPVTALSNSSWLNQFNLGGPFEDRKLVIIQMSGGNDGLNMLIPVQQYAEYANLRPNLAVPETGSRAYIQLDNTLPDPAKTGLHPDMTAMKQLYDQGKVAVVQGVAYDNVNQSHFRSTDIWLMGVDYNEYADSGWMGRYLDQAYPNYPDDFPTTDMPDPIALEIGNTISLMFNRDNGIPMALATPNPASFDSLLGSGGPLPDSFPDSGYGVEMQFLAEVFDNATTYATQLEARYNAGSNFAIYPLPGVMDYPFAVSGSTYTYVQNRLAQRLQTVARLINGGCKTRVYLVQLGGFDTHGSQVEDTDTSIGNHAALLYHFSNAVKAFIDDLTGAGNDEDVVVCSFSEFGRRPYSNGSVGTDHGTAGPMFVVGTPVQGGVVGISPDLINTTSNNNLTMQHDYRQVFTTLLSDWMGACDTTITNTLFQTYLTQKLPLISSQYNANAELPIELMMFRGWHENRVNNLEWITASETNTDYFDVERSTDGIVFEPIGRVQAAGDSQQPLTYRFRDEEPLIGYNYYRLKQVDKDEAFEYTHIINILVKGDGFQATLYPNPVETVLNVDVLSPKKVNAVMKIWDALGREVARVPVSLHSGNNKLSPPVRNLAEGTYSFELLTDDGLSIKEQFIKLGY